MSSSPGEEPLLALPWRDTDVADIWIGGRKLLLEEGESGEGDTTGRIVWDASIRLAKHVEEHMHGSSIDLTSVLELGAGTGALAIGLAFLGAKKIWATDMASALPLISRNVVLNNLDQTIYPRELEWGAPLPTWLERDATDCSLICAADVIYSADTSMAFVSTLAVLATKLQSSCRCALVLNKERSTQLISMFESSMTGAGLVWQRIAVEEHSKDGYILHKIQL